jgi:tRNA (guanine-N7-)-methyltransferase
MARRSLGKLDYDFDVSRYLRREEDIVSDTAAVACSSLFETLLPIEIEIGCGKGLFLRHISVANPDRNFVGIEIGNKYARYCAIMLAKQQSRNAIIIQGDAVTILDKCCQPDSLAAVHVYFPDPWWKRAHRKRRVLREETLRLIESRLKTDGVFYLRTDVLEYFNSTLKLVANETNLVQVQTVEEPKFQTHFERRTILHGEPVYRAVFGKK